MCTEVKDADSCKLAIVCLRLFHIQSLSVSVSPQRPRTWPRLATLSLDVTPTQKCKMVKCKKLFCAQLKAADIEQTVCVCYLIELESVYQFWIRSCLIPLHFFFLFVSI